MNYCLSGDCASMSNYWAWFGGIGGRIVVFVYQGHVWYAECCYNNQIFHYFLYYGYFISTLVYGSPDSRKQLFLSELVPRHIFHKFLLAYIPDNCTSFWKLWFLIYRYRLGLIFFRHIITRSGSSCLNIYL